MIRLAPALLGGAALLVTACSAGLLVPTSSPSDAPAPVPSPATRSQEACRLVITPDERGSAAEFRGEGFPSDTDVELEIEGGPTLTVAEDSALRTDVRGVFVTRLRAERRDIGTTRFTASAGDCRATAPSVVTSAMFLPACDPTAAAGTGGPRSDAYSALVGSDEPIHYYRFEEDTPPAATATVGADASYEGDPELAQDGVVDGSRSVLLDGDGDFIDVEPLALDGDFAVEAWVFPCGDEIDHADAIVGQHAEGPDINLWEERLRLWDGTGDPAIARAPIDWHRWVHLAVTRRSGLLELYVDGVGAGSGRHEPAFPIDAIGRGNAGSFEGRIDEVAIYDHALTAEQLAAHVAAADD